MAHRTINTIQIEIIISPVELESTEPVHYANSYTSFYFNNWQEHINYVIYSISAMRITHVPLKNLDTSSRRFHSYGIIVTYSCTSLAPDRPDDERCELPAPGAPVPDGSSPISWDADGLPSSLLHPPWSSDMVSTAADGPPVGLLEPFRFALAAALLFEFIVPSATGAAGLLSVRGGWPPEFEVGALIGLISGGGGWLFNPTIFAHVFGPDGRCCCCCCCSVGGAGGSVS